MDPKTSKLAAEILIDLQCINFSPKKKFKLTSGKESPVYCDCRRIISFPNQRKKLIQLGIRIIKNKLDLSNVDNIAGGESAGIPFASFVANQLNLPMTYIRKEKKKFGKNSQIEGIIQNHDKVLLVEDLMTDGGSKLKFIEAIDSMKASISGIFVIFNYGIIKNFLTYKKKKINVFYLTNWKFILEAAFRKKILDAKEIKVVEDFLITIGVKN
ncbi:MAG: orotate phosphoribosyltransferase [Pseudomonadota bacterium]|nr:orotate phosphoribosyltransferase [Pseudomonadota bacterium]